MNGIPFARPLLGEPEIAAAARALRSGWITQGPEVAAFERELADYIGAPHACTVSNCTAALHLALLAVGVGPGDEVITVSHSFIATANSIQYCGATPVFVDIQRGTYNLDPAALEQAITSKTRAILCVHQMGMPCDMRSIVEVARRRGLPVIEDAACAIGSEILWDNRWEKIGKPHGDIACFSFHPRKVITTGEGGLITTSNPEWDHQFRLWRQHAMSVSDAVRHASTDVVFESYVGHGYNYRMTDIQAAVGREQLRRLPEIIDRRRDLGRRYRQLLGELDGLALPEEPRWARSNWQSYCVRLPEGCDQRKVMQTLLNQGIATRRGIMCAHREPAYAESGWSCGAGPGACGCARGCCQRLRESESALAETIILPLYPQMENADQNRIVRALSEALGTRADTSHRRISPVVEAPAR